jgi:hypothetical protein
MISSSAVDRGLELRSGQTKDYKMVPCQLVPFPTRTQFFASLLSIQH